MHSPSPLHALAVAALVIGGACACCGGTTPRPADEDPVATEASTEPDDAIDPEGDQYPSD